MAHPLMPKATAVWLVENTALTFEQIADFCGLHILEVQAIADGEVAVGIRGLDPVASGQLEQSEIDRCVDDANGRLKIAKAKVPEAEQRPKGAKYTPVSKRHDRSDGIAWLIKNYPEMSDPQIAKLLGTTKDTINKIRDKTHWNAPNIKPRNPVHLGLCSVDALEKAIAVARAKAGTAFAPREAEVEEQPLAPPRSPEPTAESVFGKSPVTDEEKPEEIEETAESVFGKPPAETKPAEQNEDDQPAD